jgi:hypothetical protein
MMKYKPEKDSLLSRCEVCGNKPAHAGVNVFHQDGTIEIHHTCLNHVLDIYYKIEREINNKVKAKLVANTPIN